MSHSELFDALGFWIKQGCPRLAPLQHPLGRGAKALVRANGRIKPIQMPGVPSLQTHRSTSCDCFAVRPLPGVNPLANLDGPETPQIKQNPNSLPKQRNLYKKEISCP